jgi:hypothetical protein
VRLALATAAAAALTGTLLSATAGTATAADGTATAADGTRAPRADFNGDGIGDVAFSASGNFGANFAG